MKLLSATSRSTGLAMLWILATPAWAQTATPEPAAPPSTPLPVLVMPTTVVTATRNAQLITEALPHTTVLNAQDIAQSQATDLPTLLQREAGIQFNQSGGRGSVSSLFVRGAASSQLLVLVDGVPMTKQDATGSISLEHLMLNQIERIEIVRGNVSAIYGTGAIGGVVQVFTKQGGPASASVLLEAGSRGSFKLETSLNQQFGKDIKTNIAVNLGSNRTTGFSALDTSMAANVDANPDKDGYSNKHWNLALTMQLSKDHKISFSATRSTGKFDFDSTFFTASDTQKGSTKLDSVAISSDNKITANWHSKLTLAQSSELNENVYGGAFPVQDQYRSKNQILTWNNTIALGTAWSLNAGLEGQRQGADVDDGYGGLYAKSRSVNAFFTGLQGTLGAHSLQVNLRRDQTALASTQTAAYLGYGLNVTPAWKLIANASNAFNLAPLGYLYAPYFGNPDLKPEQAQSRELGVQYAQGQTTVRGTYFKNHVKNQFTYDYASYQFQNIDRSRNAGLEVSLNTRFANTQLRASFTAQNPIDEATQTLLNRRAKTLFSLGATQNMGAWKLNADLRYTGARDDTGVALAAYKVLDLSANYALTGSVKLFGRLENALDTNYQTVYGYQQARRGIYLGMQWQPNY